MNKQSSSLKIISLVLVAALICSVVFNVAFVSVVGTAHAAAGIETVAAARQEDAAPNTNVTATFNPADIDIDQLTLKYIDQEVVQKNIAAYDGERWVIVELDGTTLYDEYERQHSFESFAEYAASPAAKSVMTSINASHWAFLDKLDRHGISYEYKYSYSTINNGVAIKINAEAYNAVKQMAGVSGVYYSESYAVPKTFGENDAHVYTTGIYKSDDIEDANGNKYQGEGMVVAILDTGLDRTHEAFQHMPADMDKAAMNRDYIADIIANGSGDYKLNAVGTVDDLYYSDKVPFAYDYADDDANVFPSYSSHGTHVAGIVAGKSDYVVNEATDDEATGETFVGVAPEAQLVICKVFTDDLESEMLGGADDIDILAAISDCVTLGVDIINMSLGTSAGFSDEPSNQHLTAVYNRVWQAGISLVVAASNDYSSGYGGGNGTNLLTNPDSGTVGSPSTYDSALSVASINGQKSEYIVANNDPNQVAFITNASDINGNEIEWVDEMFNKFGQDKFGQDKVELKLKYVVIGGVGRDGNYSAVKRLFNDDNYDATIALVKRGTTTFEEKVDTAMRSGADACIIYNNVSGTIRMSLGNLENPIPTCSITMDAGKVFVDNAERSVGTITVRRDYLAGPYMSEFSSWGPTPDLKLKPEITAHGGEITSAVAGGYDVYSGTSMAAPNMAGATALLRQYLKGVMFPGVQRLNAEQNRQLNARVNQTLMSTATIARNEDNNPYSPRKQGAGLASIKNAVNTEAYITVPLKGAEGVSDKVSDKAKIELGDDPEREGVYEFSFIVNNISTVAQVYNPIAYVMTETIASDGRTVAEKAYMLQDMCKITYEVNGANVDSISVEAGQTATVNVRIELLSAAKTYLAKFANGMYVEGFVSLKNAAADAVTADAVTAAAVTIGLPFLAYYGDWTDGPLFDYDTYELAESDRTETFEENKLKASAAETRVLGLYYDDQYILPLGQYIYKQDELTQQKMYPDRKKAAISMYDNYLYESIPLTEGRHTVYELYMVYAGLLRNAAFIDLQITDAATGELVYGKVIADQGKSYAAGGSNRGSGIMLELNPYEWGMTNNSTYNVRLVGQLDMVHKEDYVDYDIKYEMEYAPGTSESQKTQTNRIYEFYGNSFKNLKDSSLTIGKTYYFKETASDGSTLYPAKDRSSFDFQFTVDYEDPQLLDYKLRFEPIKDGNKVTYSIYLDLYVYDNQYVQAVLPCYLKEDRALGTNVLTLLTEYPIPVEASAPGETTKITLDVTDYYDSYIKTGNLYVSILDYALNHFAANLVIREGTVDYPEESGGIWFAEDDKLTYNKFTNTGSLDSGDGYPNYNLTIAPYELYKLTLDSTMDGIRVDLPSMYWAGNAPYIKVKDDEIYAYGKPGSRTTLTLKQSESANSKIYATITVTIGEDVGNQLPSPSKLTFKSTLNGDDYLNDMSSAAPQVEMYSNQKLSLEVEITPWYLNANYLPIDIAGQITYQWVVATGKEYIDIPENASGNAITVSTKAQGNASVSITVAKEGGRSVKKTVKLSIKSDFDAENYTLYNYYGGETCIIPDYLNVMYIDEDCFKNNKLVKHITLPASLTEIPKNCFSGCENLEDITINGKCIVVGVNAFAGCKNLRTVTLGTFVDSNQKPLPDQYKGSLAIGAYAFKGCVSLQTIENPQRITTIYDEAFMDCTSLTEIDITALRVVGASVFAGCTGLTTVQHSADTVIGKSMFEGCINLNSFEFNGVRVPDNAFLNCSNLSNVTFAEGLLSIGQNAFGNASKLQSISLPNGRIEIASSAFAGCTELQSVELDSDTELVFANGTPFISCRKFTTYTIKGGASNFYTEKDGVLYSENGKKLVSVPVGKPCGTQEQVNAILEGVDTIGRTAFAGNLSLAEITLVNGDKAYQLEPYAFAGAAKLTKVTLTNSQTAITSIPEGLFMNASSLTTATGSTGVTYIGTRAFSGTRINASFTGAVEIGDYAFYGSNLNGTLTFGNLTKIGAYAFAGCASIRSINAPQAAEVGDCAFANITSLATLTLGPVTKMGNGILSGSTAAISAVTFGEGTTYIGRSVFGQGDAMVEAFLNSNGSQSSSAGIARAVTITIPDSVTAIGAYAFTGLLNLNAVNLAGVKQIGDYAFMRTGVSQLLRTVPADGVYTLEAEYIGKFAFSGTKVTKLSLPNAYDIGAMAFMDCENLTSIVFGYSDTDDGHDFKVGQYAFYGSGLSEVTLPSALVSRYYVYDWNMYDLKNRIEETKYRFENALADGAFAGVEKLTAIHVGSEDGVFFEQDGVLYSRVADGLVLEQYPAGKLGEEFTVPEGVVAIAASAFEGSQNLKKVILPSSLKVIGNAAFFHTKAADMQYVFKSVQAPTLVADFDMYMSDQADALLTEYYCNFYNYSIKASPTIFVSPQYFSMSAVVPVNGNGYDTPLWQHFFTNEVDGKTVVNITYSGEVAVATETSSAIEAIDALSAAYEAMAADITVKQFFAAGGINEIAKAARASYNKLSDSIQIELASEAYAELERIESALRTFKRQKFNMVINTKGGRDAITVISSPNKLKYNAGERFDCTGMVIRLNYDDGSSVVIADDKITAAKNALSSEYKYATVYVVDDMGNTVQREIAIDVIGEGGGQDDGSQKAGLGAGAIAGIAIAVIAVVAIAAGIAAVAILKKRKKTANVAANPEDNQKVGGDEHEEENPEATATLDAEQTDADAEKNEQDGEEE